MEKSEANLGFLRPCLKKEKGRKSKEERRAGQEGREGGREMLFLKKYFLGMDADVEFHFRV